MEASISKFFALLIFETEFLITSFSLFAHPEMGKVLRKVMPKSFILVPGYGAQGGTAKDLAPYFNEDGLGAIVNSSRGIIAAYKQPAYASYGEEGYAEASRAAAIAMKEDLATIF